MTNSHPRALRAIPWPVYGLLVVALSAQWSWARQQQLPSISIEQLPLAPASAKLQVLAMGEPGIVSRLLMLWLQGFDYQPGVSVSFAELDYKKLEAWLDRLIDLDPEFQYPLLAAARIYGEVRAPEKQRQMLGFVARRFKQRPRERWQWMAHAVFIAQHRLADQQLALQLARELSAVPADPAIPSWARQMHIFVLENMGELEAAKVLLGGLLDSGEIVDENERWFLSHRLHELEQRSSKP